MTDWNKLKVVDLKAELKKRGLVQTGLKPALVARLAEAENNDGTESEATLQDESAKHDASSAASPDTVSPVIPSRGTGEEVAPDPLIVPAPSDPVELPQIETPGNAQPDKVETVQETSNTTPPTTDLPLEDFAQKDAHGSALPSVEPQEAIEDRQKRKRRSQSPPISASDAARKRSRLSDDIAVVGNETNDDVPTLIEKDLENVDVGEIIEMEPEAAPTTAESGSRDSATQAAADVEPDAVMVDVEETTDLPAAVEEHTEGAKEDAEKDTNMVDVVEGNSEVEGIIGSMVSAKHEEQHSVLESPSQPRSLRYKDLFTPDKPQEVPSYQAQSRDIENGPMEVDSGRVDPAIHHATSALYIRDFMRPLNPAQLKTYLTDLAAPPGSEADPEDISTFYLDPIRTHAFVLFTNTSAASRVRNALHGKTWPEERTRKPLWIDFVPVEKVEQWISEEQANSQGPRSQAKKWEVYYHTNEDRVVTVELQEATNRPRQLSSSAPPIATLMPTPQVSIASRNTFVAPTGPRDPYERPMRASTNFKTLDELFKSTTAKPVLYYQPVAKALAEKRLDNLEKALSEDAAAGRRISGDINRYTFEDGDQLVDRGPELFGGIRPPRGFRGPTFDDGRGGGFRGRGRVDRGFAGGYGGGPDRGFSDRGSSRDFGGGLDRGYDRGFDRDSDRSYGGNRGRGNIRYGPDSIGRRDRY